MNHSNQSIDSIEAADQITRSDQRNQSNQTNQLPRAHHPMHAMMKAMTNAVVMMTVTTNAVIKVMPDIHNYTISMIFGNIYISYSSVINYVFVIYFPHTRCYVVLMSVRYAIRLGWTGVR
jgi:hypothetical protein